MTTSEGKDLFKISVILSTYNRSNILKKTLESFIELNTKDLTHTITVVDNNSSDATEEVCREFMGKLPLEYLFQRKAGKNKALNLAIRTIELGDVIVFTDDDVNPDNNWLQTVRDSVESHPTYLVFGGPVHLIWPEGVPHWCKTLEKVIYAQHTYGPKNVQYEEGSFPIGPNFWVRSEIFTKHHFSYNESIGPIPDKKKRAMGSETTFLKNIEQEGFKMMHIAQSSVGHYVTSDQTTPSYIRNRARTHGRFIARTQPNFDNLKTYKKSIFLWKALKVAAVTKSWLKLQITKLIPNPSTRYLRQVQACRWLAYHTTYLFDHKRIWTDKEFKTSIARNQ